MVYVDPYDILVFGCNCITILSADGWIGFCVVASVFVFEKVLI